MNKIDLTEIVKSVKDKDSKEGRILLFGMAIISAISYEKKHKKNRCLHYIIDEMEIEETYEKFFGDDFIKPNLDIVYAMEKLFIDFGPEIEI